MKSDLSVLQLTTPQALRDCAEQWDDLWLRSEMTHPTAQAAMITNWLDYFLHDAKFHAVVVLQDGRFVGALPLMTRTKGRVVACMDVPGNEWSSAGQLLIDPASDTEVVCDLLVAALARLDCSAFWFASVPVNARWWGTLMAAARRGNWSVEARCRYQVGRMELKSTWSQQSRALSKGMRKQLGKSIRQLKSQGALRLHVARPTRGDRALGLLETGLALEHAGWKGAAGTSVLANEREWQFIQDLARQLIANKQLVLSLLEHNGHNIAFEFGWCAKQVYHSYKVAYDEQMSQFSPGQLMVYHLLEHFHRSDEIRSFDFLGPEDAAIRRWQPQSYPMGRLLMAPPKPAGRALVLAARYLLTRGTSPLRVQS